MDSIEQHRSCVCVAAEFAQKMRHCLESNGVRDERYRLTKLPDGTNEIAIPLLQGMQDTVVKDITQSGMYCDIPCRFITASLPISKKSMIKTPLATLTHNLKALLEGANLMWTEELANDIPKQWEKHGDMVILSKWSFNHVIWAQIDSKCLWNLVAQSFGCSRIAKKGVIQNNDFRSPRIELLLGDNGWVEHTDNGIRYTYDIRYCMFSSGNISEKIRVASFNCEGETVVDMYAGIGYFTLPYLVHAKAMTVHACEWNPHAVRALEQNLKLNNMTDRCRIHQGNNIQVCPKGVADRVNLGLIPSSENGWATACAALKPHSGGILHIHGNVTTTPQNTMKESMPASANEEALHRMNTCNDVNETLTVSKSYEENSVNKPTCDLQVLTKYPDVIGKKPGQRPDVQTSSSVQNDFILPQAEEQRSHTTRPHTNVLPRIGKKENVHQMSKTEKASGVDGARCHWNAWAESVASRIHCILEEVHSGKDWSVKVIYVEHVKSYAPHVDHIVADLKCWPK